MDLVQLQIPHITFSPLLEDVVVEEMVQEIHSDQSMKEITKNCGG